MASVISDNIDCPQCGYPAQKDEYFITSEERITCNWCGYSHLKTLDDISTTKGYGTIHYYKNNNGSNTLEKIVRLNTLSNVINNHNIILDIQTNYDIHNSKFFVWNDITNKLDCLVGRKPKTIDESYDEIRNELEYYNQINSYSNNGSNGDIEF